MGAVVSYVVYERDLEMFAMAKSKIIGEESGILANPSFIFSICVSLAFLSQNITECTTRNIQKHVKQFPCASTNVYPIHQ
jgi:hypothetical protein